jgi:hypothetical protein
VEDPLQRLRDEVARQDEHSHVDAAVRKRIAEVLLEAEHERLNEAARRIVHRLSTEERASLSPTGSTRRPRSRGSRRRAVKLAPGSDYRAAALVVALASFVVNAHVTRQERERRISEIDLLRRQVEREDAERDERRRAWISAEQGQVSGGDRADEFTFIVNNLRPAAVRDVDLKVRTLGDEDATSRIQVARAMMVGSEARCA